MTRFVDFSDWKQVWQFLKNEPTFNVGHTEIKRCEEKHV